MLRSPNLSILGHEDQVQVPLPPPNVGITQGQCLPLNIRCSGTEVLCDAAMVPEKPKVFLQSRQPTVLKGFHHGQSRFSISSGLARF